MTAKKKPKSTQAEQSARFIETARKLGADERPEEFDKVIEKIAKRKPQPKSGTPNT
jgi:hypothetical protein